MSTTIAAIAVAAITAAYVIIDELRARREEERMNNCDDRRNRRRRPDINKYKRTYDRNPFMYTDRRHYSNVRRARRYNDFYNTNENFGGYDPPPDYEYNAYREDPYYDDGYRDDMYGGYNPPPPEPPRYHGYNGYYEEYNRPDDSRRYDREYTNPGHVGYGWGTEYTPEDYYYDDWYGSRKTGYRRKNYDDYYNYNYNNYYQKPSYRTSHVGYGWGTEYGDPWSAYNNDDVLLAGL